jgi:hypothetical protein
MLPFGRVRGTFTTFEVFRPSTHDENGRKLAWEMGDPFKVTASVPASKVQVAVSTTLIDPLVTKEPDLGVAAAKASGPGAGKA